MWLKNSADMLTELPAGWRSSSWVQSQNVPITDQRAPPFQVSRWSRSSVVAWPSSSRGRRPRPSASGRRSTAPRPTSWPRAHRRPSLTPRSRRAAPRLRPWFTTPSCTTSPPQPESNHTTPLAWRAQTAWTPAYPRGTTRPARQITCPGTKAFREPFEPSWFTPWIMHQKIHFWLVLAERSSLHGFL